MSIMIDIKFYLLLLIFVSLSGVCEADQKKSGIFSNWQNPDIGMTLDGVVDLDDAEGPWKSQGINLRGAELIVSANIDPYAFLAGNILLTEHGAELHEAYSLFPYLPFNLKLKLGKMLANFGHWNLYHVHSIPFTSEPDIYKVYADGMLALTGFEFSWMLPIGHFIEITLSAYDRIQGHTHDNGLFAIANLASNRSLEQIASEIGAEKHGTHWHSVDGKILSEQELLALTDSEEPAEPQIITGKRRLAGFAYGGKLLTSIEIGQHITVDLSGSAIYQHEYKKSRCPELNDYSYSKLLYDASLVIYWHPLTSNRYRNFQTGVEMLGTYEGFERISNDWIVEQYSNRSGFFGWFCWRPARRWQFGGFTEFFEADNNQEDFYKRFGGFITFNLSHYQYIRAEYSRFYYPQILDGVNQLRVQYDASIGYHSHGRQR